MGSFGPPRPYENYQYPDLVERLGQMLVEGAELRRRRELQEQQLERQARLDEMRAAEEAQQQEDRGLQRQLTIAGLERGAAAQQPILPESGEPLPGALPGPPTEAESVGAQGKFQTITLPGGKTLQLAPLQSRQTLEEETQAKAAREAMAKLGFVTAEARAREKAKAEFRPEPEVKAPATRNINGREMGFNPETKRFDIDYGPSGAPDKPKASETPEAKAEAQSYAQGIAQDWYAGLTFPMTQKDTGIAIKYMNDHPEEFPKGHPRKLTPSMQASAVSLTDTVQTIDDVRAAYAKVKDKIGPVTYTFNEFLRRLPGTEEDPDFVTFNALLRGMDNIEIKNVTGAAMTDSEAGRLLKAMATGDMKPGDFEAALGVMERNANRKRDITLWGKAGKWTPGGAGGTAEATTGGAPGGAPGGATGKTVGKYKILSVE
jgi:hypothetical protein